MPKLPTHMASDFVEDEGMFDDLLPEGVSMVGLIGAHVSYLLKQQSQEVSCCHGRSRVRSWLWDVLRPDLKQSQEDSCSAGFV